MASQDLVGPRIKMMRRQRGLSQAQLAHPELSDSYVSLIESGKRTPTPVVLELLAAKLDCSPTYLINGVTAEQMHEFDLALRYARMALENGEMAEAKRRFAELLADPAIGGLDELRFQADLGHALALEGCGDLAGAVERLTSLLDHPADSSARTDSRAARRIAVAVALCRCHREHGNLTESVQVGEQTLAEQSPTGWSDALVELGATLLAAYHERGDLTRAQQLADELLDVAETLGTPRARVAAHWNAAMVSNAAGRAGEAFALAERALAIQTETGEGRNLARLRLAYALMLLRSRPEEVARTRDMLLETERELAETSASAVDRARCTLHLASCDNLQGRPEDGERRAREAISQFGDAPVLLVAEAYLVLGQAYLLLGRAADAAAALTEAADRLEEMKASRQAAQAWFQLAEFLGKLGDSDRSADAYQRALACVAL